MAGKLYEKAKRFYGKEGGWDKRQLKNIVAKNSENLSAEEYEEITGEAYEAPVKALTETEQAIMDTAINTEYLVALAELGQ